MVFSVISGTCLRVLPIVCLCCGGLVKSGLALTPNAGQRPDQVAMNSRLLRSEDGSEVEVDSSGKGRLGSGKLASSRALSAIATQGSGSSEPAALDAQNGGPTATTPSGPQVQNGGFEEGSTTTNYKFSQEIPGWTVLGEGAMFIFGGSNTDGSIGSPEFQNIKSANGNYLLGFNGIGSGVYQSVGGHVPGNWYRLLWHSSFSVMKGEAKLKVSVDAAQKFNQAVKSGELGWYEITYKADAPQVVINLGHSGPAGDKTVFIDSVHIKPVKPWAMQNGLVTIQKVPCTGYPSAQTCTQGKFLSVGDFDEDGATGVMETDSATATSVWFARHENSRWSFQSQGLKQLSTPSGQQPSGDLWYLHSDYTKCEARNWESSPTSHFDVRLNGIGYHQISNMGSECGSLFAIQSFLETDTVAAA